jgi:hypothetical protein
MLKDMDCQVAVDGSLLSPLALQANNALVIVPPTQGNPHTVIAGDNTAGVNVTGTTSPTTVQIINTSLPGTALPNCTSNNVTYPGPLCTYLDQYPGAAHLISFVPPPAGSPTFYSAECVDLTQVPLAAVNSLHLGHNIPNPSGGEQVEILPYAPANNAPVLAGCNTASAAPLSDLYRLARAGDLRGAASQVGSLVASFFATDAMATGTTGSGKTTITGSSHGGSPFIPVDTTVFITATSPTSQNGSIGAQVTPPAVLVQTRGVPGGSPTPLPGVTVAFGAPQGSTQLTGNGCPVGCDTVTTTTDANGKASVATWTLVVGVNTVNAIATYPLQTGPAPLGAHGIVTVSGSPLAFTAMGTGNVINYLDVNYFVHQGDVATPMTSTGWNTLLDPLWQAGQPASFGDDIPGSLPYNGNYCPLDQTIKTVWNSNPSGTTFLLLQKTFVLPPGYQGDLKVGVAIDNDVQVFVNGVDITAGGVLGTYGGPRNYDGQFLEHEGCATLDSYFIPATQAATNLQAGSNVISVRARDRGVISLVDIRLSTP